MEDLLEIGRIENRIAVSPNRNRSARSDDALGFAKKSVGVEPVKRLRNCDQIDRFVGQPARLRGGNSIFDVTGGFGLGELLRARIRRNDAIEVFGKTARRLAVSGTAVESYAVRARQARNEIKQRLRIFGPVCRVESGPL